MIRHNEIVPGEIKEFIVQGTGSANEITETIANQYREGLKGVLWNLSDPSFTNLSVSEMRTIASFAKQYATHKKTAYFSPHDLQFGLLRMYEAYAEAGEVAPLMMVFRDRDEAIEWLKEQPDEPATA